MKPFEKSRKDDDRKGAGKEGSKADQRRDKAEKREPEKGRAQAKRAPGKG